MRHRKLMPSDVEVDVFEAGAGEVILYLHGFQAFRPEAAFFDPIMVSNRVIAPIHPGYGDGVVPEWLDRPEDAAHIYFSLLDELGVKRFHLAGAGLGGWIASEMASMASDRLLSLALVAPVGAKLGSRDALDVPDLYKFSDEAFYRTLYSQGSSRTFDPEVMTDEDLLAFFRSREAIALYAWEPWMHNPKLARRLARVKAKTMIIRGAEDRLITKWYADEFAKLFSNCSRVELAGIGHDVLGEAPSEIASLLMQHSAGC